ncbi:MAG: hypothetical protein QOK15_1896 [Nocardioidaceae bacterium]|jgi:hypothetical protein|nr:hypothetical protein [Nocardioidaceae bacterium]
MAELVIGQRFNGPPGSANGGYAAGATAEAVRASTGWSEDVTVRLLRPPPLDEPLRLAPVEEAVEVRTGGAQDPTDSAARRAKTTQADLVALARQESPPAWHPTEPVALERARVVEGSYPGLLAHPFPTCFSCGPGRDPGDGLRIFPGRLQAGLVASSWTPHASVAGDDGTVGLPVTWAALDCVGGWSSDLEHRPLVLAEMCARVASPPQAGTAYVVVGTLLRSEGRKTWTASAMFDGDRLVGQAEQLWLAVDWAVVQHLQSS